ncbi:MAG: chromosome partitioning protein, partial [Gemmatimonadota bacterium]
SPPNPSELLGSPLMDSLIQRARESFEAIVIDTPPMLAVTDAVVLGGKLDGVLVVVRADRTHRKAAEDALDQLRRVGARVLGVVVNDARATGRYGYKYAYYYEYYSEDQDGRRRRRHRLLPRGTGADAESETPV